MAESSKILIISNRLDFNKIRTRYNGFYRNLLPLYKNDIESIILMTSLVIQNLPKELQHKILFTLLSNINDNLGMIHNKFRELATITKIFELDWLHKFPFRKAIDERFQKDFFQTKEYITIQFENIKIYNVHREL